jgi:hypothetical protein
LSRSSLKLLSFDDFGVSNNSRDGGNAKMITAAAVSKAGAIEIPSDATAGQPVSF